VRLWRLLARVYFLLVFLPPLGALFLAFGKTLSLTFLKDAIYLRALSNTFILALGATGLSVLLSLPLATLLAKSRFPLARLWAVLLAVPLLFLPYQTALAWSFILPAPVLKLLFSPWGVVFIFTISFFPLVFWPLYLSFLSIPREAEESGLLLAPPLKVFTRVTLPYAKPYLLGGAGLCFIFSFTEIGAPTYLGVPVIGSEILTRFAAFYDLQGALNASLPLAITGLLFFLLERPFVKRWEIAPRWRDPRGLLFESRPFFLLGGLFLGVTLLVAVFLPLSVLAFKAFSGDFWSVLTRAKSPLLRTFLYTGGAAILAGGVALVSQPLLEEREKDLWDTLALLAFFLPSVVLAVGLIYFWGRFPLVYSSWVLLLLGLLCHFGFLTQRLLREAWRRFDKGGLEAAYLAGRGFNAIFRRIILPPLSPWFGYALAIFFIFAANEMTLSSLLYPPGGATLAVTIYTLSVNNPLSVSAGLCLLNTLFILVVVSLLLCLLRPGADGSRSA